MAKTKFERASVAYGLTSQVVDPTIASRQFEKQVAANVASQVKNVKWYMERETDAGGRTGYKYFTLAKVPKDSLNEAFKKTAKENLDDAKKRADAAATEQAKNQEVQAADFWQKQTESGLIE